MNFQARRVFAIASIFPAISLLIFFLFISPAFAGSQETPVKIGVRAHSGAEAALKKWSPTADYLSHRIKGYSFEMVPFAWFDGMRTTMKKGEIDFLLTNPTAYVKM